MSMYEPDGNTTRFTS